MIPCGDTAVVDAMLGKSLPDTPELCQFVRVWKCATIFANSRGTQKPRQIHLPLIFPHVLFEFIKPRGRMIAYV